MKKALFYPYINVPPERWIFQMLLYVDEIGSIVPYEFAIRQAKMQPFMRELVSANLVKNVIPAEYAHINSRFTDSFLNIVEKKILSKKKNSLSNDYYKIHIEKMDPRLVTELRKMRLLEYSDYPWFIVEKKTAIFFMAFLASVICIDPSLEMVPFTNEKKFLKPYLSDNISELPSTFNQNDELAITISRILPVPDNAISIANLIAFKEKHGPLLTGFRNEIERKIEFISSLDDKSSRNFHLEMFIQESQEKIDELKSKMEEQRWGKINFGTICSIGSASIPVIEAMLEKDPSELLKSLPGIAGAIYSVQYDFFKARKEIRSSPFAYAAFEQKYRFRNAT